MLWQTAQELMPSGVDSLQIAFILLLFVTIVVGALAKRLNTPYPILLVIAGLLVSFVPGSPRITLNPDVIFSVFLPPLLYAAAWNTSWREFSNALVNILLLAIGLVAFTVVGVAMVACSFFETFDWRTGVVLGAAVSTTDAIAATSIARRLGVARRIVDIIEGESLVNDATGLLALQFGIAAIVNNQSFSAAAGILRFAYLGIGGIVVGFVVSIVVERFEHEIDDGPIEIAISILVPYAAYFAAEELHVSGVLAVVTCGLYLSRKSVAFFSPGVRIEARAVWQALTFVLNGIVFVLIGLQLPVILSGIRDHSLRELIGFGALLSLVVIVLRLLWLFPSARIAWIIRTRILHHQLTPPPPRAVFVVGWTGLRGVIALAAAMSLPQALANGAPFPNRDVIIFLTYCVILATLVGQGLTLPPLIRLLGLESSQHVDQEEFEARREILEGALGRLEDLRKQDAGPFTDVYDDVARHYRTRLSTLRGEGSDEHGTTTDHARLYDDVSRELVRLERRIAIDLRNQGRVSDEALRRVLYELDLDETRMAAEGEAKPE
jgi:CPA1 family monovalent cation:H+ antiporter